MATFSLQDSSKSPKPIKKFLNKRKTERKPSEDEYLLRKSRLSGILVTRALVNRETKQEVEHESLFVELIRPSVTIESFKSQMWLWCCN